MKYALLILFSLTLTGCLRIAAPTMMNGYYFMAGDSNCAQTNQVSTTAIQCFDTKGYFTEYRYALSSDQVVNHQIQMQQLNQQLQQTNQALQNTTQSIIQQSQQFTPPQVQPVAPQGTGTIYYRKTGNTWLGSNGSSCQVVGQSIICSGGERCQMVGQNLICN